MKPNSIYKKNLSLVFLDGIGLLCASFVFFGIAILSFGNLLNYSRADFFFTSGDTRGLGVFMMVLPSAVLMLMIGARSLFEKLIAVFVALISFLVMLLSGYRSAALFPTMVGIIIWVKIGRKIPVAISTSIIVFVIFIIPVIGIFRNMGPYNKLNVKSFEKSIEEAKAQDTFIELGGTAGVLAHAFRLVPTIDPYRYGMTYVKGFRDSIPNIMPRKGESYRRKSKQEALFDPSVIGTMAVPSDWITYRIDRYKFNKGDGYGFSAIGEPYINFGIVGVVIYFALLGFFLGRLDGKNLLDHPRLMIFTCALLWPLLRTVRNDFSNFVKPAIFIIIILGIWRMITRIFNINRV